MTEWLVDDNGNRTSVTYFGSRERARYVLDNLLDCRDCTNCVNCYGCIGCSHCIECEDCTDCEYCYDVRALSGKAYTVDLSRCANQQFADRVMAVVS